MKILSPRYLYDGILSCGASSVHLCFHRSRNCGMHIGPCIHKLLRLFPCGLCPCSLVTRNTENEPLFSLSGRFHNYVVPLQQNKGSLSFWRVTRVQGHTPQGNKQPMDTGSKKKIEIKQYVLLQW